MRQQWFIIPLILACAVSGYGQDHKITRKIGGRDRTFVVDPAHEGRGSWTTVWRDESERNEVIQLSPTILQYNYYEEHEGTLSSYAQPVKLEFMDKSFHTIREVDLRMTRPYQDIGEDRLSYVKSFSDEAGRHVGPYKGPKTGLLPTEYTLYTKVSSDGDHIIVTYWLLGLIHGYEIISTQQTIRIYDPQGNLWYESGEIPVIDTEAVSNNRRYLIYTYGTSELLYRGTGNAAGWGVMRLADNKIMYTEPMDAKRYTFCGYTVEGNLVNLTQTNGRGTTDCGYWVLLDSAVDMLYRYRISYNEMRTIYKEMEENKITDELHYVFRLLDFEPIPMPGE